MAAESAASLHVGAGGSVDVALVFVLALCASVGAVAMGPAIVWGVDECHYYVRRLIRLLDRLLGLVRVCHCCDFGASVGC